MEENMNSWNDLDILINDYRNGLIEEKNNFSMKILSFLNMGPERLVREFEDHPGARLVAKNGDWFSLWAGRVSIDGEHYSHTTVIRRIKELLAGNSLNT